MLPTQTAPQEPTGNPMGSQMQRLMMQLRRDVQMLIQAMEMQGIPPDQIQAVILQAIQGEQPTAGPEQGMQGEGIPESPEQIQVPPMP
ncbi:MAG TPA: hypothetical protein PKJ08_00025 [Candidatus Cloacimonadota bacterium]|nr:hypothetical protein [Candidatus Cloacimonadota bacterium]